MHTCGLAPALRACLQVVTFAILEGFRAKAYEKTGEVGGWVVCVWGWGWGGGGGWVGG